MTLSELHDQVASSNWETRYSAVRDLSKRKGKKALALLEKASGDNNQSVRCAAAISLGERAAADGVSCLVEMLADPDDWVRIRAVQALGKIGDDTSIDFIVQHLDSEEDVKVRATMVKTIGGSGDEKYLPVLVPYLSDEDQRVRANTIEGMGNFKSRKVQQIVKKFVKDPNSRIRANAARVLAGLGGTRTAKQTFQQMLADKNQFMRCSAVFALGELRNEAYLPLLLEMTGDSSFVVRRNAVDSLVKYGNVVLRQVDRMVNDEDPQKRTSACQILAEIGDQRSLRRLIPLLEDPDGEVRASAEEAIDGIRRRGK